MAARPAPEIEVIHPEVEILPSNHPEPASAGNGSRVWLTVDSQGGTRRVYVAKPGPIATILLLLAFGMLVLVSIVVTLGLFAIVFAISTVALAGLFIYGLVRSALKRIR
jgi:hypothetical protein